MITFMQKNKKYLVVTIWVSVISFIGAGFVGYGSVDLNIARSTGVASVGKLNVTQQEFQKRYSDIFNYYNQFQNGSLDQDMAIAMGLDKEALKSLIQEKLLLNYANDLGFFISDSDVANRIKQDSSFFKDGVFDKNTYLQTLKQIGFSASEYEKQIKNSLMLEKVFALLDIKANQEEIDMLNSSLFMQDLVGLKTLTLNKVDVSDSELNEFWEKTKQDYKTTQTNEISFYIEPLVTQTYSDDDIKEYYNENRFDFKNDKEEIVSLDEAKNDVIKALNLKQIKNNANHSYVALKNGKKEFSDKKVVDINDVDIINFISDMKEGDISRPFEYKDTYMIVRLDRINESREKTFEEAKKEAKEAFIVVKTKQELEKMAKSYNGSYKNIGFINRDTTKSTTSGLSEVEFINVVNSILSSNEKQSYVLLDDKAVAYKILEQNLENPSKLEVHGEILQKRMDSLKKAALLEEVLEDLQKRYPVNIYYGKGK